MKGKSTLRGANQAEGLGGPDKIAAGEVWDQAVQVPRIELAESLLKDSADTIRRLAATNRILSAKVEVINQMHDIFNRAPSGLVSSEHDQSHYAIERIERFLRNKE